jgi:hypothetical protein
MLIDVHFPESLVGVVLDAWAIGLGRVTDESIIASITALSEKFNTEMALDSANGVDEAALEILAATRGLQLISWALRRGVNGPDGNRTLTATFSEFIIEAMQSTSPDMRSLAVQCMGLMGLSSADVCDQFRGILFQVASTGLEEEDIRAVACKALVDMAVVHSSKHADDAALINLLLRLMEGEGSSLRVLAAESTAKLLFSGTLTESRLFACLLKFFFLPDLAVGSNEEGVGADEALAQQVLSDRLQQLLAVFFQSFFMAGKGRERVAWESISDIVSDIAMLVRSGQAQSSALASIMNHLLSMCENVARLSAAKSSAEDADAMNTTVQEILDDSETARVACRARLAASVSREVLKFGSSKADKLAANDFVKVLVSLDPSLWASPAVAATMARVAQCIQTSCALEKTAKTGLAAFITSCEAVAASEPAVDEEEEEAEMSKAKEQEIVFLSFAPGLIDLVDCMMDSSNAPAPPALKALQKKVAAAVTEGGRARAKVVAETSAGETQLGRPVRGAKRAAQKKLAAAVDEDDDDEEDEPDEEAASDEENTPPTQVTA